MDKKSQHVGDHGGKYVDRDGQTKQFTYIDHDIKPKVSSILDMSEEERKELRDTLNLYRDREIAQILALPAVSFLKSGNMFAEDYIIRDLEKGIIWNEVFTKNALSINSDMRYTVHLSVWRNTVKEQYWFEDMSHEDILSGKWKEWT